MDNELENSVLTEAETEVENDKITQTAVSETENAGTVTEPTPPEKQKLKISDLIFFIISGGLILCLVTHIILFSFVFFHVSVSGSSMQNTLQSGDVLIANKVKQVTRGDVVIINGVKTGGDFLIKRVIAMEGDTVKIENGKVYVNGVEIIEEYTKIQNKTFCRNEEGKLTPQAKTFTLGENELFYLGDNREDSLDSRYYGACKEENISGVVTQSAINFKTVSTPINNFMLKIKLLVGIKS